MAVTHARGLSMARSGDDLRAHRSPPLGPGYVGDLEMGSFTDAGPWRVDRAAMAWAQGLEPVRADAQAEVPALMKRRLLHAIERSLGLGDESLSYADVRGRRELIRGRLRDGADERAVERQTELP